MEKAFDIQGLELRYERKLAPVIQHCNLEIGQGTLTAFLGENGIGKSTLLKAMAGLLAAHEGSIMLFGKPISGYSRAELAKTIAVVLTEPISAGLLRVHDFVAYGRYPFTNWLGKLKEEDIHLVNQAIKRCGLEQLACNYLTDLSDGERQKVMIARALAQQTPIIILDEPTTHLDQRNSRAIFALLNTLVKEENKTILFSTHQVEPALQLADQLVIHSESGIYLTSPKDFYQNTKLQKELLGEDSVLDAETGKINMNF